MNPRACYQLYVESLTPAGAGDLHARYEQLRARLATEGLFDADRKRALPRWPRRIGVVTSPVGAVWQDIRNVVRRRYPLVQLVLSPPWSREKRRPRRWSWRSSGSSRSAASIW